MSGMLRWRRAIVVSVFAHVFLWAAAGYVTGRLPAVSPVNEQTVELDLASLPDSGPAMNQPQPEPAAMQTEPASVEEQPESPEPAPVEEVVPLTEPKPMPQPTLEKPAVPVATAAKIKHGPMATPPSVILKVDPVYPSSARPTAATNIVLKVEIKEDGLPGKIVVMGTSGQKALDDAAIVSLKKWRFLPAQDGDGVAMSCYTIVRVPIIQR